MQHGHNVCVFMINIQHNKCLRAVSPFINIDELQYQHG